MPRSVSAARSSSRAGRGRRRGARRARPTPPRPAARRRRGSRAYQPATRRRAVVPGVEVPQLHAQRPRPGACRAARSSPRRRARPSSPRRAGRAARIRVGELVVVRRHRAGVAERAEVLARVEAERGEPAERADAPALVARAVRLARVLDERDAVRVAELDERVEIGRLPVEVDGDQRARRGPSSRRRPRSASISPVVSSQSTSTTSRAELHDGQDRRDEGVRGRDHLVARADAERLEAEVERGGAGVDTDA